MATDTHRLRAFAAYLAGDGYTDEHVRMIEEAADEIERLEPENAELSRQVSAAMREVMRLDAETERLRARDETLRRYEHLDATQWAYLPVATVTKAEG